MRRAVELEYKSSLRGDAESRTGLTGQVTGDGKPVPRRNGVAGVRKLVGIAADERREPSKTLELIACVGKTGGTATRVVCRGATGI